MSELTLENLAKLPMEEQARLQNMLKELQDKADRGVLDAANANTLAEINKHLGEVVESNTKAINALVTLNQTKEEEKQFDELEAENFVAVFKSLPITDPKREEIRQALVKEYGEFKTDLALFGNDVHKALLKPIAQTSTKFDEVAEFRKAWDYAMILTSARQGVTPGSRPDSVELNYNEFKKSLEMLQKQGVYGADSAMTLIEKAHATTNAGFGAEQVPVLLSSNMLEDVWLELKAASLFRRYAMPQKTFEMPIRTTRMRGYIADEAVSDTAVGNATPFMANFFTPTSVGTGKIQFSARKYGAIAFVSDELEQDSTLPILDLIREDLIYGIADGIEDAVINGTYGTSVGDVQTFMDNAGLSANRLWSDSGVGIRDARALWDGLRRDIVQSGVTTIDGAPASSWKAEGLDFLRNARKNLGKYGATSTDDLVWIIAPEFHMELLKLNEVITVDKYGSNATILSGEIGKIDGIPIVISPRMYTNLNNLGYFSNGVATTAGAGNGFQSGVASDTSANKTSALIVNRKGWAFGDRMQLRVESERQMISESRAVKASWRGDFKKVFANAEPVANMVRNLSR
jgi:hypothetical protein